MAEAATESPARRKRPPRPPPVESKPVLAGRLWIVIAMLIALGIITNPVFNNMVVRHFAPKPEVPLGGTWKVGHEATVNLTLITADYNRLACAHDQEAADGAHCAFQQNGQPWPRDPDGPVDDNRRNIIQPYRTSPGNQLLLVTGLWAEPTLAMRLHREPPQDVPIKRLIRFDATCKVKFVHKFDRVKLRWDIGAPWQTERNALVARPVWCKIPTR